MEDAETQVRDSMAWGALGGNRVHEYVFIRTKSSRNISSVSLIEAAAKG